MESRECCYIQRPGLPGFDKLAENGALWSVESFPLVEQILLDYLVRSLHVDWHHSQPFRRLWTIPGVVDISILHSPRSVTRMQCRKSILRSRVSSYASEVISACAASNSSLCRTLSAAAAAAKRDGRRSSFLQDGLRLAADGLAAQGAARSSSPAAVLLLMLAQCRVAYTSAARSST